MSTQPLPIALLGAGIFAREVHLPAILSNPSVKLTAIYSRSLSSAQNTLSSVPSHTGSTEIKLYSEDQDSTSTLAALLAREDIKAVVVALPILTQPEIIKQCILAGKHVLSEKPVAPTLAEALEMQKWYNANSDAGKTIWSVAENYRFQSSWADGLKAASELGGVKGVEVKMFQSVERGGKYFETAWRKVPGYQGGFLLDGGVHFTAALRQLLPKHHSLTVSCFSQLLQDHLTPHDTVRAIFKSEPKVVTNEDPVITGTFNMSFGCSSVRGTSYTLDCPGGVVVVAPQELKVTENGKDEVVTKYEEDPRGVGRELEAFRKAIEGGVRGGDKLQSVELAIGDLEMVEEMLNSGEQGGKPITMKYFTQL